MKRTSITVAAGALCALVLAAGCKEDPKEEVLPPNKPLVEKGSATCEKVEGRYLLSKLSFEVSDLDGIADLAKVEARVERYSDLQPLVTEPVPLTAEQIEVEKLEGPVRNTYAWERSASGPDYFCGEAGNVLDISIRAEDTLGYADEILISPSPL
jgi:hypothetical protein